MMRPMTEDDLGAVARLEHVLFGAGAWSSETLAEEFHAPHRRYVVDVQDVQNPQGTDPVRQDADEADGVRGYAGYWFDGDDAELMTIGVAPDHQGKGIATRMLAALINDARNTTHARRMLLEVRTDNEPALAVYHKLGFYRIGLRRRYYQPGNKDAYTMALDLRPRVVGFAAGGHSTIGGEPERTSVAQTAADMAGTSAADE